MAALGNGFRAVLLGFTSLWASLHVAGGADGAGGRQLPVVRLEELVNTAVLLGCYNDTELDNLGVGTDSAFTFVSGTTRMMQSSASPYLNITVQKEDDGIRIHCVPAPSSKFLSRLQEHPHLTGITPPVYEIKTLYPVEFVSQLVLSNTPAPCDTVVCPYVGSSPVSYRFYMNHTGPFSCSGICNTCNRSESCVAITDSQQQQCYNAQDDACFRRVTDNSVIIRQGCYGCLTCEASNTVKGETRPQHRSFNLNRLSSSTCHVCDTANSGSFRFSGEPVISPSSNVTVGAAELNITFEFFNRYPTSVTLYNATTRRVILVYGSSVYHDSEPTVLASNTCKFVYKLTVLRPTVTEGGVLLFEFLSGSGRKYYKNVTIHVTERLCQDSQLACRNGRCLLDWSGQPSCVCNPNQFGQSCQLQCPKSSGSSVPLVSTEVIIPVGCDVTIVLECPYPGNRTFYGITWRQNDGGAIAHGRTFQFLHGSISRRYDGNYSCLDTSTSEYLGSVQVYIADRPVLVTGFVDNQVIRITNESQAIRLDINSTATYNATNVGFAWAATGGSLCGWTRDACVLQKNSSVLDILHLPCCSGTYRGCAINDYGPSCLTVQVEVAGSAVCPAQPVLLGPPGNMPTDSGASYIDFVGGESAVVDWYLVGDTSQRPKKQTICQALRVGNSSCCCRRSELTDVASGIYMACVVASNGAAERWCYPPIVHSSLETPSMFFGTLNITLLSVAMAALLIITAVVIRFRGRLVRNGCRPRTKVLPIEETPLVGGAETDSVDDFPVQDFAVQELEDASFPKPAEGRNVGGSDHEDDDVVAIKTGLSNGDQPPRRNTSPPRQGLNVSRVLPVPVATVAAVPSARVDSDVTAQRGALIAPVQDTNPPTQVSSERAPSEANAPSSFSPVSDQEEEGSGKLVATAVGGTVVEYAPGDIQSPRDALLGTMRNLAKNEGCHDASGSQNRSHAAFGTPTVAAGTGRGTLQSVDIAVAGKEGREVNLKELHRAHPHQDYAGARSDDRLASGDVTSTLDGHDEGDAMMDEVTKA